MPSGKVSKLKRKGGNGNGTKGMIATVIVDAYRDHVVVKGPANNLQTISILVEGQKAVVEKMIQDHLKEDNRIMVAKPAIMVPGGN